MLASIADFVERMRKGGAVACRVGPVHVSWAGPPLPQPTKGGRRRELTDEDILMHSA